MVWHSEKVVGLDAAVEVLNRLFFRLESFQCVVLQPREGVAIKVFDKPWPSPIYVISGKLLPEDASRLLVTTQQLGLSAFDTTCAGDGSRGFSYSSLNQNLNVAETCRRILQIFVDDSSTIAVHGVTGTVKVFPPDLEVGGQ